MAWAAAVVVAPLALAAGAELVAGVVALLHGLLCGLVGLDHQDLCAACVGHWDTVGGDHAACARHDGVGL